jgi:protein-tyrosine phosphatase
MSRWFSSYGLGEVAPDLLIGAYPQDEEDVEALERNGIVRVLNLVEDGEYGPGARAIVEQRYARAGIVEERLSLPDYGSLPPEALDRATELVNAWLDEGARCYVHCRAGWQRSAAVAAAVVALRAGADIGSALHAVQTRRPSASPLPHQREDLARWWEARQTRGRDEDLGIEPERASEPQPQG